MNNIIKATVYRLSKSNTAKISFIITCVAAVLYFIFAFQLSRGSMSIENAGNITGLGDSLIIWLFGSMMTGTIVCADFESKVIHGVIIYGRKRIIMNYTITFAITIIVLTLPYTIGSIICLASGKSFAGAEGAAISIYLDNVIRGIQDVSIWKVVALYVVNAFIYIGQISVCLMVAVCVRKPVVVTAFGFMFGMLIALFRSLIDKSVVLTKIFKFTPFAYSLTNINRDTSTGNLMLAAAASLVFLALMGIFSYLIFRKSEIK